jgi:myo-inositol 2-dehydrogenase/D-chiro-inositol 1-dehydrogenase
MIRIGWIGCGTHAGEMQLPQLVRLDVRLEALCDLDPGRLTRIADR